MNIFNIANTFKMKKVRGWPEVYFCIDLHGTIIPSGKDSNDKTDLMEFYPYAKEVLQYLSNRKDIIMILWTSTPVDRLSNVIGALEANGIRFKYYNENPHAKSTPRSDFARKFYFSVLIDDRAGFEPQTDWKLIKDELIRIGEWKECNHEWGTDGMHFNVFCKKCFIDKE
jgi:hypothetical protein